MVAHEVSKHVLLAIVDAFPEPWTGAITGIEITQGPGGDVCASTSATYPNSEPARVTNPFS